MRIAMRAALYAAVVLALGAGAAQAGSGALTPTETTVCLDVAGQSQPATCYVPASRLDLREYICLCLDGGQSVAAPVCGPNERQPGEGIDLMKVRKVAARDGSLIGDRYRGQPMCVAPRRP